MSMHFAVADILDAAAAVHHRLEVVGYSGSGSVAHKLLGEACWDIVTFPLSYRNAHRTCSGGFRYVGSAMLDEAARWLGLSRSGYGILAYIVASAVESALKDCVISMIG